MPGFLGKWSQGPPAPLRPPPPQCSASLAGRGRKLLPSGRWEKPASESRGVIQVSCSQPDPVPSYPPSLRKLRRAVCPGEVTQLGSLAESGLIGPRSPAPQLPGFRGPVVPWKLGRSKGHSWTQLTWVLSPGQPSFLSRGSEVPRTTPTLRNLVFFFPARARGTSPGEQVLLVSSGPASTGSPAAEQMAGRFVLPRHPVRGRGGGPCCRLPCEPGREPLGACPDVGPHPCWPGGGGAAVVVVREGRLPLPLCPQGGLGGRKSALLTGR